jgi:hypothetical protein
MHTSCLISAAVFTCRLFNLSLPVLSYLFSFSPTIMASARSFHGVVGIQNDTPYTLEPRKRHVGRRRISAKCASPHHHFLSRIYRDSDPSDRRDSGSYSQKLRSCEIMPVEKMNFYILYFLEIYEFCRASCSCCPTRSSYSACVCETLRDPGLLV